MKAIGQDLISASDKPAFFRVGNAGGLGISTPDNRLGDGLRTLSGTTMGSAALTDLVPRNQLAKAFSKMWSFMGIAIIASPLVASRVAAVLSKCISAVRSLPR